MALFGVDVSGVEEWAAEPEHPDVFEVYPENAKACEVFMSMSTQWIWTGGMESRRAGLNHAVFPLHLDKCRISKKDRFAVMDDVQTMEHAALAVWAQG